MTLWGRLLTSERELTFLGAAGADGSGGSAGCWWPERVCCDVTWPDLQDEMLDVRLDMEDDEDEIELRRLRGLTGVTGRQLTWRCCCCWGFWLAGVGAVEGGLCTCVGRGGSGQPRIGWRDDGLLLITKVAGGC